MWCAASRYLDQSQKIGERCAMPLCRADVQLHLHRARAIARAPVPTTRAFLARNDNTPKPKGKPSGVSALKKTVLCSGALARQSAGRGVFRCRSHSQL